MASEQEKPTRPRGRRKKITGIILFWVGFAGIINSLIMIFVVGYGHYSEEYVYVGIPIGIVSLLMTDVGVFLFIEGRSEEKSRKNRKVLLGVILLVIGIEVLGSCLYLALFGCYDVECIGFAIFMLIVAGIGGVLALIGLILVLIGKSQEISQRNQNTFPA